MVEILLSSASLSLGYLSPNKTKSKVKLWLQDFEVIKELPKGAFGVVKLVKRISNEKAYALKIVSKEVMRNMKCLQNEKKILEMWADCPFIIKLYDTFDDDANVYFLLQYIQGGELTTVFSNHRIQMQKDGVLMSSIGK